MAFCKSGCSETSEETVTNTPLIHREESHPPNHFKTALFGLIALILGVTRSIATAILVPESLKVGLNIAEASIILAAFPLSTLLVLFIQPVMNRLNDVLYFFVTGVLNCAGFCSFYFSVTVPHYYLYIAVLARVTCGTTLFLINNKTVVGITDHLRGDISKSSFLWEVFYSAGQACGAYIGSWLDTKIGFPLAMTVPGGAILLTVAILSCCYPRHRTRVTESEDTSTQNIYLFYVSRDMLVYCWCPMVCIGGCNVYGEGIITEFYLKEYSKSLQFGGMLLGLGGIVYCISAIVIGLLRERWPCLKLAGLLAGLLGCGVCLPFIGPLVAPPGQYKLILSVAAFNLLTVSSCAIQLNSLTLSADKLSPSLDSQLAVSVSLNGVSVAYNLGAFVGPIVGGTLATKLNFSEAFALGAPFFVLAALIVGTFHFSNRGDN